MTAEEITSKLKSTYGPDLEVVETTQPEPFIYISFARYHDFCQSARDDKELDFDFLFQLAGVHYPDDRFEVVLCLASHEKRHRMVVKVKLDINDPQVDTVSDVWQVAAWYEREAMELFGIKFHNHPDPGPLLLPEDWEWGYPMRRGWTGPDFIPMPEK